MGIKGIHKQTLPVFSCCGPKTTRYCYCHEALTMERLRMTMGAMAQHLLEHGLITLGPQFLVVVKTGKPRD